MSMQKYKLYSIVQCVSGRQEIAAIHERQVSVIGYRKEEGQGYIYTVALDSKSPQSFECFERELRPAEQKGTYESDDPYWIIRNMLGRYLNQDFDLQVDSVADAIHAAIRQTDPGKLALAIEDLEKQADWVIQDVLVDHDVAIWDETTPRDLLITIKTLVRLS